MTSRKDVNKFYQSGGSIRAPPIRSDAGRFGGGRSATPDFSGAYSTRASPRPQPVRHLSPALNVSRTPIRISPISSSAGRFNASAAATAPNFDTAYSTGNPLGLDEPQRIAPSPGPLSFTQRAQAPTSSNPLSTASPAPEAPRQDGRKIGGGLTAQTKGLLISVLLISVLVGVIYLVLTTANNAAGSLTISVAPSGGLPPYSFSWYSGSTTCSSGLVPGANTNTLTINGQPSLYYSVSVTDSASATSCSNFTT